MFLTRIYGRSEDVLDILKRPYGQVDWQLERKLVQALQRMERIFEPWIKIREFLITRCNEQVSEKSSFFYYYYLLFLHQNSMLCMCGKWSHLLAQFSNIFCWQRNKIELCRFLYLWHFSNF